MRQITTVIAVIAALVLVGSGSWPFPNLGTTYAETPEQITIGKMPLMAHALIYIAEDQGYFDANGLNVTIKDYSTGPASIKGLLSGEVDISGSGEYAIVGHALEKENIGIIASIDKYMFFYLAGRKDQGIENVSDLKGKKIAFNRGSQAEFLLGRFLDLNDMNIRDITIMNVQPSEFVDSIANGSPDAVVYTQPYDDAIKDHLGNNGAFWSVHSDQPLYSVMVCRNDWVADHPKTITRFLRSLAMAEEYSINHPDEAKAIVQKRLNCSNAYIAAVWPDHKFSLTLDQSLILAMEDEARWMIKNNLTAEKHVPNFLDYIHEDELKAIKPEAVNIIR